MYHYYYIDIAHFISENLEKEQDYLDNLDSSFLIRIDFLKDEVSFFNHKLKLWANNSFIYQYASPKYKLSHKHFNIGQIFNFMKKDLHLDFSKSLIRLEPSELLCRLL